MRGLEVGCIWLSGMNPEAIVILMLTLGCRPTGPSQTETGRQSQERTVREVWRRVRELAYTRPGA